MAFLFYAKPIVVEARAPHVTWQSSKTTRMAESVRAVGVVLVFQQAVDIASLTWCLQ